MRHARLLSPKPQKLAGASVLLLNFYGEHFPAHSGSAALRLVARLTGIRQASSLTRKILSSSASAASSVDTQPPRYITWGSEPQPASHKRDKKRRALPMKCGRGEARTPSAIASSGRKHGGKAGRCPRGRSHGKKAPSSGATGPYRHSVLDSSNKRPLFTTEKSPPVPVTNRSGRRALKSPCRAPLPLRRVNAGKLMAASQIQATRRRPPPPHPAYVRPASFGEVPTLFFSSPLLPR